MIAVLENGLDCPKAAPKECAAWSAWRVNDEEIRVQVNRPDIARAFAKLKSARLAGYSVCGNYLKLFTIKESVPWVESWMKDFIRRDSTHEPQRKELELN
jgi:hypothetical protein